MLKSCLCYLLAALAVSGETLRLKDKASISGRVLEVKKDQIFIDVGYTVLAVPKSQVLKVEQGTASEPAPSVAVEAPAAPVAAKMAEGDGFYSVATAPLRERSVRELVHELGAAVVQVRTPAGLGSGFFINEDGYLVTNFHVTEGETQLSVEVFEERGGQIERKVYKQVRIVALNKFRDLALLRVEDRSAPKFAHVILGDSDSLAVGEPVFAIGSPLGLERTVTQGIISTKTREFEGELYLQTTAQINPGNSGGPLFNMRGEVVGVTNMKITVGEGLGFAIPVELVKYVLNHRDSFAYDNDNPSNPYRYLEPPSRTRKVAAE
ncbi:MAG TPA: trypsin-like peptidase domain-containing protein [Verrucomicrobiae bacterium]|jgi:serine protease Do|nr:trypsin-like peptidase domain-containing protein [Verrucomicrobiae bacterium]